MRILKVKWFVRFARKEGIDDPHLVDAIERADRGLIDADLGGGLIKQRVARPGAGRSGGFRTVVAYRAGDLAVFLFGFPKSGRDNIGDNELSVFRDIAAEWLAADAATLAMQVEKGLAEEVEK